MLDEARNEVAEIGLTNAQPKKWVGPTLAAKGGGEVAMEELHLVHEGLEYQMTPDDRHRPRDPRRARRLLPSRRSRSPGSRSSEWTWPPSSGSRRAARRSSRWTTSRSTRRGRQPPAHGAGPGRELGRLRRAVRRASRAPACCRTPWPPSSPRAGGAPTSCGWSPGRGGRDGRRSGRPTAGLRGVPVAPRRAGAAGAQRGHLG